MSVNKKTNEPAKRAASFAFSALCGYISSALCVLIFSAVMYILGMPENMAGMLSLISFGTGCFICGLVCGMIKKHRGLLSGLICAIIMYAPILSVSALCGSFTPGNAGVKLLIAGAASCAGAVVGVNRRPQR